MSNLLRSMLATGFVLLTAGFAKLGDAAPAAVAAPSALPRVMTVNATINFGASSTLHDFQGSVKLDSFSATSTGSPGNQKWSGDIKVPVRKMSTNHAGRDEKMYTMFNADQYPAIVGTFTGVSVPKLGEAVPMELRIRNIKRPVPLTITEWHANGSGVEVTATGQISLAAFGLKPPSVMGMVKVGDSVWLSIHVTAQADRKSASKVSP